MGINWGIAQQPNAFDRNFQRGFQLGEYQRQRREETERQNALASYAMKPNEAGFNALAMAAPEYAMQVSQQRQQAAREQMLGDLRARAANGDRAAAAELVRYEPNEANSIASNRRAYEGQMVTAAASLAQQVLAAPPEQRAGIYQSQIPILAQRFPELAGHEYSDELMYSTINEAGQWQEYNRSQQPDYMAIPEGGTLVNTRNPQAVQAFQGGGPQAQPAPAPQTQIRVTPREYSALVNRYGPEAVQQRIAAGQAIVTVQTPDEARTLPSGTRILLPDGTEGRVP